MKKLTTMGGLGLLSLVLFWSCTPAAPLPNADPETRKIPPNALYKDATKSPEERAANLLSYMTLKEKIGQMTQAARDFLGNDLEIKQYALGSLLSGGGSGPSNNNVQAWADMYDRYQKQALATDLAIPLIYGIDAVHGNNNLKGATIFPHNVGLGATQNADLVQNIARATALETAATGIRWTFAPCIAVPQDSRWGRTYEGFSEDTSLTARLGAAAVRGFQGAADQSQLDEYPYILATAKHYIGDGGTTMGVDQGNTEMDEATLRERFLPPYVEAIKAGVGSVMISFSSWNGLKMHQHKYLITDVLKGELGFKGIIVSDWAGVKQLPGTPRQQIELAINAGIDMVMVPDNWKDFILDLTVAVQNGTVPQARIDEAVLRILTIKFAMGLFEMPMSDRSYLTQVGSEEHRALGRQAVRESMVLLKNSGVLPLAKSGLKIAVVGQGANDIGLQSGGWTISWQGMPGDITPGTTILDGIKSLVADPASVVYSLDGANIGNPDVVIVVAAEQPYAEMKGDSSTLAFPKAASDIITRLDTKGAKVITVLLSGRPLVSTKEVAASDAFIAAWLPGTEGAGVADVLFGDYKPTGKLPYTWFETVDAIPVHSTEPGPGILFPRGFGLSY